MSVNYQIHRLLDKIERREGVWEFFRCLYYEVRLRWLLPIFRGSYSPDGEDIIVDRLLEFKKNGMYIDIGCGEPICGNHCYRFYRRGWDGISVDADPTVYEAFSKRRPRAVNLNAAICSTEGEKMYYCMFPPSLSTLSRDIAENHVQRGFQLRAVKRMQTFTLRGLFERYAAGRKIDFLNVDCEGLDYEVLLSNNWSEWKPTVICVERIDPKTGSASSRLNDYLASNGYRKMADTINNSIFQLME